MSNVDFHFIFSITYLLLLEIVNGPDTYIRFILTTFTPGQLRNICWVVVLIYEHVYYDLDNKQNIYEYYHLKWIQVLCW